MHGETMKLLKTIFCPLMVGYYFE